jgi:hypothetical protein
MTQLLTIDQLQTAMPAQVKGKVTQELVNNFNNMVMDDEFREHYRNNLVGFGSVMDDGRFTVDQYMNAVRYISYKLMGDSNVKAYMRTFPAKYSNFKSQGIKDKVIASYVHAYDKTKLVNLIRDQSSIPFHVQNMDNRQKALNVLIDLMANSNSDKVKSDSASAVLTHLKPPESKKLEIEVSQVESSAIDELRHATQEHAKILKQNIEVGTMSAKEAAQGDLVIAGEYETIDE